VEWRFRPMSDGEINVDPIEGEFFTTDALDSLADGLVREAIQNSLDARVPGKEVRVRFRYSGPKLAFGQVERRAFLEGLWPHLESPNCGLLDLPGINEDMDFLLIEDYGTRGLMGDPSQVEDLDETKKGSRNDFYYFWRNIGRTAKKETDLGRWGLGKTVFQAASRINVFFGFTRRKGDGRCFLMGQAVLKIHKEGSTRYAPYGYFGNFEGDLALPCDEPQELQAFSEAFWVRRESPGLSVVIPFPSAEITTDEINRSVAHHYFVSILKGDLVVEVENGVHNVILDRDKLLQDSPISPMVTLAEWTLRDGAGRDVCTCTPQGKAPQWSPAILPEPVLRRCREALERDRRVAFEVPIWVTPKGESPKATSFIVSIQREVGLKRGEATYVRDGVTLSGVRTSMPPELRAFLFVGDPLLSRFLGDCENPAHTEWQERSAKFKDAYELGPSTLRFIKNAPRELWDILSKPAQGRDEELLKDIFSIDVKELEQEAEPEPSDSEEPGEGESADGTGEIAGTDPTVKLVRLKGGFRVKAASGVSTIPDEIRIRAAYEVRRGNPFTRYNPLDFALNEDPISIKWRQAALIEAGENTLVVKPESRTFSVTVKGFDAHRDLRVLVEVVQPMSPGNSP